MINKIISIPFFFFAVLLFYGSFSPGMDPQKALVGTVASTGLFITAAIFATSK